MYAETTESGSKPEFAIQIIIGTAGHLVHGADGVVRAYLITGKGYLEGGYMDGRGGGNIEEWVSEDKGNTWRMNRDLTPDRETVSQLGALIIFNRLYDQTVRSSTVCFCSTAGRIVILRLQKAFLLHE
jgi:hypothetical protein